jgi:uncharacterized membrane protein required for colicin V production
VDVVGFIKTAPVVDLAIIGALAVSFFLGALQGAIRRLLGIASIVLAFLIAANSRDFVGGFFDSNWRQFNHDYNRMLAFLIVFGLSAAIATVLMQAFYKRVDINSNHPVVDDVVGGLVGVLEGLIVLLVLVVIFNSYQPPLFPASDIPQVRDLQSALTQDSQIAMWLRDNGAPLVVHVFSPLLPSDIVRMYP